MITFIDEVHDQSGITEDRYKPSAQTRFKTSMLRSDLCVFQALIQDFVREGDSLLPKNVPGAQRREYFPGSTRGIGRHAPPETF